MVAKVAIISLLILLIVLAALGMGVYLARRQERIRAREQGLSLSGTLSRHEEQALVALLASAAHVMRGLGTDNETTLGLDMKIDVGRWLQVYDAKTKIKEKVN